MFSKDKRAIYMRKVKGFWAEYSRTRIGLLGLGLLVFFIFFAILGPYIAPYPPTRMPEVADSFAMPEWMSIFPQYADLPRTSDMLILDMDVSQSSSFVDVLRGKNISLSYKGEGVGDVAVVRLTKNFTYQYQSPQKFRFTATYAAMNISSTEYKSEIILTDAKGNDWVIIDETKRTDLSFARWVVTSSAGSLRQRLFGNSTTNPAEVIFGNKGNCSLSLRITFKPRSANARGTITVTEGTFTIQGSLHGILGTDGLGRDVYSQILHGAGTSIMVGLLTAVVTMSVATLAGMTAGYLGGNVDGAIMRVVDVVLCMPMFVILLILKRNFSLDIVTTMVFISLFFWAGPARTIRSRVQSLKERTFIENARAAGGSGFYIIRRHIFPNIIPLTMASLILFVPVGILMEATLSFLGFGDPTSFTWGKMISEARATGGFTNLAWWYVIPPGLAITLLCVSFVFIGHALDTIVNPRLRKRR
jgi:peptide/nickel transport system permease protein